MVVCQESLHVENLDLFDGDSRLELTKDPKVAKLEVRADLEGEGCLGEVPSHTVHSDQHGMGPGKPDGQRASDGSLADWSWFLLMTRLLLTTWCVAQSHSPLRRGTATHQSGGCLPASVPAAGPHGAPRQQVHFYMCHLEFRMPISIETKKPKAIRF